MESFNEDADGLFACLLEEPGGDQSVNYEDNQSKNTGGNHSFGYDDSYGQDNPPKPDDLGGGGGDDAGGLSLGAQFLDLVANTIGKSSSKCSIMKLLR